MEGFVYEFQGSQIAVIFICNQKVNKFPCTQFIYFSFENIHANYVTQFFFY